MDDLKSLIPVSYDNPERPTVSGRELHEFLEVTTRYNDWFNRMTEYGFTEGEDYYSFLSKSAWRRAAVNMLPTPSVSMILTFSQKNIPTR